MTYLNTLSTFLLTFGFYAQAYAQPALQSYLPKRVEVGFHQWGEDAPLTISGFLHLESASSGDTIMFPARLTESGGVVTGNNKGGSLVVGHIGLKDQQRVNRSLSAPGSAGTSIESIHVTVHPAFSASFQRQRRGADGRRHFIVARSATGFVELETYHVGGDDFEARSPDFYLNFSRLVRNGIPFSR